MVVKHFALLRKDKRGFHSIRKMLNEEYGCVNEGYRNKGKKRPWIKVDNALRRRLGKA